MELREAFLTVHWLPAMKPPGVRGTTWTEDRRKINSHVVPRLGSVPLQSLGPAQLNAFYADLLAAGRTDGTGGLAPKTVREIHVIVRKALKDAVRWGHVSRNVADLANPPSQRASAAARWRTMQTWTPAELHAFLEHDPEDRLHYAWVLAATTGMRRSEVLGLRWADVDLGGTRLAVRQRLASVDGRPELSEPKSNSSGRVIDLDERTPRRCAADGHSRASTASLAAPPGTTSTWSCHARTAYGSTRTGSASCSADGSRQPTSAQ